MLTTPDRIFTSPDGHGGAIRAVRQSGILKEWRVAGVATGCPFCFIMLDDGIKELGAEGRVDVKDLATLLDEASSGD